MDLCQAVEQQLDEVTLCVGATHNESIYKLDEMIHRLTRIKSQLRPQREPEERYDGDSDLDTASISSSVLEELQDTLKKLPSCVNTIGLKHRDYHKAISKVGKAIGKGLSAEPKLDSCQSPEADSSSEMQATQEEIQKKQKDLLGEAIVQHLHHEGMTAIGEDLALEMGLSGTAALGIRKANLLKINQVLADLGNKNLHSAVEWAMENRGTLLERGSNLEFKLHRFVFIKILIESQSDSSGGIRGINYARKYFQPLADRHESEIRTLMGALLYFSRVGGLKNLPLMIGGSKEEGRLSHYREILNDPETNWAEIQRLFRRDASAVLQIPVESFLNVSFAAGCEVLPQQASVRKMLNEFVVRVGGVYKFPAPVEVKLAKDFQYHSLVVCPILRQPTSSKNPAMRLRCGHIISREALHSLTYRGLYRCPYCPWSQHIRHATQVQI